MNNLEIEEFEEDDKEFEMVSNLFYMFKRLGLANRVMYGFYAQAHYAYLKGGSEAVSEFWEGLDG